MIRLNPFAGRRIGSAHSAYGKQLYGDVGHGISFGVGAPQLSASLFREVEARVNAVVYPYGTRPYGGDGVRQAEVNVEIDQIKFAGDEVNAPLLHELDTDVHMRMLPDGTLQCSEFVEV